MALVRTGRQRRCYITYRRGPPHSSTLDATKMPPCVKNLFVVAITACALAACDWLRGGWYGVTGIDTTMVPERLSRDQRDFFEIIDAVAQRRGLRSTACAADVAERKTCRSYEAAKSTYLV